jgi:hypothetical protein
VGKIKKDSKRRESPPAPREVINESSGLNDLIIRNSFTSVPPKRSDEDLLSDMDKRVLKELNFEKADLFYLKMDPEFKSDLDNLISDCSSIFGGKEDCATNA